MTLKMRSKHVETLHYLLDTKFLYTRLCFRAFKVKIYPFCWFCGEHVRYYIILLLAEHLKRVDSDM